MNNRSITLDRPGKDWREWVPVIVIVWLYLTIYISLSPGILCDRLLCTFIFVILCSLGNTSVVIGNRQD